MGTALAAAEFARLLSTFESTAFRLELQPAYSEPSEHATVARFLAGEPEPPTEVAGLQAWFEQIRRLAAEGRRVERVRVHEDPPTDYQRWERWIGAWNVEAGETIRYMTRARAYEVGLLPAAGTEDWWLLDENKLVVMRFDDQGNRIHNELVTDPARVLQACEWRDLAVHHSAPDEDRSAAA